MQIKAIENNIKNILVFELISYVTNLFLFYTKNLSWKWLINNKKSNLTNGHILNKHLKMIILVSSLIFVHNNLLSQATSSDSSVIYAQIKNPKLLKNILLKKGNKASAKHLLKDLIDSFDINEISNPFSFTKNKSLSLIVKFKFNKIYAKNTFKRLTSKSLFKNLEFGVKYFPIMQHTDTASSILWHDFDLNLAKAHTVTRGDSSVVIAVIDYVFNDKNRDLLGKWWTNKNEIPNDNIDNDSNGYIDDVHGWNFGNSTNNPFYFLAGLPQVKIDRYKHGTAVSSLIAGEVDNGNSTVGACPGCRIMPLNIQLVDSMDYYPKWENHGVDPYDAFIYAAYNGAKIINCSFGRKDYSITAMEDIVFHYCDSMGCILVGGSGNNFNFKQFGEENLHFYPANDSRFISVGATSKDRFLSKFTNAGKYTKIDVVAPGDNIICAGVKNNNYFIQASGTSLSTPLVSGILGLIKSKFPSFTRAQILQTLYNACNSIDYKNFEFSNQLGHGLPNAYACVLNKSLKRADFYTENLEQETLKDSVVRFYCQEFPYGKYIWNWGDGTSNTTNSNSIYKTYSQPGLYSIMLISIDTNSNYKDTIFKSNYFFVQKYKIPNFNYDKNWFVGDNVQLNFGRQGKYLTKNSPFQNKYSNGILTPLNQDKLNFTSNIFEKSINGFIYEQNLGVQVNTSLSSFADTLTHNLALFNCSQIYLESTGSSLLKSGYLLPDIVSDSIIFLQHNSVYQNQNFNTIKSYKISKNGGFKNYQIKLSIDTSLGYNWNGSMIYDDFIVFPNYDSNYYWLLSRPTDIANFGTGDYLVLHKLINYGNGLKFDFVKKINTQLNDSINTSNFMSMFISPNGSKLAIQYDSFICIYNFNNKTGGINLVHKVSISMSGILGAYTQNIVFSADSKLLYGVMESEGSQIYELYQINLEESQFRLFPKIVEKSISNRYTALTLGPDSLIYINNSFDNKLSVISKPQVQITSNFSNECGYLNYGIDYNTTVPLSLRDTLKNSHLGFPLIINHNIPDSIKLFYKFRTCDSVELCSNFPRRIFHKWIFNSDTVNSLYPVVRVLNFQSNQIKFIVDSLVINQTVDFSDSINNLKIKFNPEKYLNIYDDSSAFGKVRITLKDNPLFNALDSVYWSNQEGVYTVGKYADTFEFSKPFYYYGIAKNYCFPIPFGPISVKFPCSDSKYNTAYYNNSNGQHTLPHLDTGVIILTGVNYINPGNTLRLNNCVVMMENDASLEIMEGGRLIADSVYFVSCGTWKGIKVHGNPMLNLGRDTSGSIHGAVVLTNCQIMDAVVGVESVQGGYLYLDKNIFVGNNYHLNVLDYPHPHFSIISNNDFKFTFGTDTIYNSYNLYSIHGKTVDYQFKISDVKNQSINNCKFSNIRFSGDPTKLNKVSLVLNNTESIELLNNNFEGIEDAFMVFDTSSINNRFVHNDFRAVNSMNAYTNTINLKTKGLTILNPKNAYISLNLFQYGYSGIQYYQHNSANSPSLIEKNKFQNMEFGLISAFKTNPLLINSINTKSPVKFNLTCNTFLDCNYGWVGTGRYVQFDSSNIPISQPKSNLFYRSKFQNGVLNDNIARNYYNSILEKFDTITSFSINLDGIDYNNFNFLTQCLNSYNSITYVKNGLPYNCSGKRSKLGSNLIESSELFIYPNPSIETLYISSLNYFSCKISDLKGNILLNDIKSTNNINISKLSPGIYIIEFNCNDGKRKSQKFIKID